MELLEESNYKELVTEKVKKHFDSNKAYESKQFFNNNNISPLDINNYNVLSHKYNDMILVQ